LLERCVGLRGDDREKQPRGNNNGALNHLAS
jgi:hypothetical protein